MSKDCKKCDPKTKKVSSIPTGTKTPLMKVARDGDTKRVDTLIKNGANINAFDENFSTALIQAADKGRFECVGLLLKAGANVNMSNISGINALMSAVYGNHVECVDALLTAGASAETPKRMCRNVPPLIAAASDTLAGHFECMKLLVKAGANLNVHHSRDHISQTPLISTVLEEKKLEFLINAGCDVNVTGPNGMSALMKAAARGKLSCSQMLLNAGANVNAQDKFDGNTPLIYAALGHLEFLAYNLGNPFHLNVAAPGTSECLKLLLDAGADVNKPDQRGNTSLHIAAFGTNVECLKLLIEAEADVNANTTTPIAVLKHVIMKFITTRDKPPIPPPAHTLPKPKQTQQLPTDALNCLRLLLKAGSPMHELCSCPIRKHKDTMSEVNTNDSKPSLFQEYFKLLHAAGELHWSIPPLGVKEREILTLKDICRDVIRNHLIDLDPHTNLFSAESQSYTCLVISNPSY